MLGLMSDQQLLISSLIEHSGKYHGQTEIIDCAIDGKIYKTNYSDTLVRVKKLANSLKNLNVNLGDTIGTLAWSNLRHLELYYGVSGIGAICHTINPRLFKEQIIYIINDAKNKFLFVDLDFFDLVVEISNEINTVEHIVVLGKKKDIPNTKNISKKVIAYEDLIENVSVLNEWPIFSEKTASSLCYTSGTTGNPKGVLYSHRSTLIHTLAAANPDSSESSKLPSVLSSADIAELTAH